MLGRGFGKRIGRDEGDIDMRIVEQKREIARAAIAQHGSDAQARAGREEARHVGRQHGFRGGRGACDQAEPSLGALILRERAAARRDATEDETKEERERPTQYTPRIPLSAPRNIEVPAAERR